MRSIVTVIAILILAGAASGQMADQAALDKLSNDASVGLSPGNSPFSLLDFSRIKWSNSYSVSFFSGGYGSGTMGLFQTNMLYEFTPSLSLALNIGIAHSGGVFSTEQDASILPGFTLDYHPSNKFRAILQVQTYQGYLNPYYFNRSNYWFEPVGP